MAERVLGLEQTAGLINRIAPSLTETKQDPVEFELVRRILGEKLSDGWPKVAKE
jgi:hypothetical protein